MSDLSNKAKNFFQLIKLIWIMAKKRINNYLSVKIIQQLLTVNSSFQSQDEKNVSRQFQKREILNFPWIWK